MLFHSDRLVDRTNCSPEAKKIRVFLQIAAASLRISNRQRELRLPKSYGAWPLEAEPLHAQSHRESTREGWVRAMRLGCKLRRAIARDVRYLSAPQLHPNAQAVSHARFTHYNRGLTDKNAPYIAQNRERERPSIREALPINPPCRPAYLFSIGRRPRNPDPVGPACLLS